MVQLFSGKLISDNDKEIVIQSGSMGDVRLEKSNIRSMTAVAATDQKAGGIWFANPNSSNTFWDPQLFLLRRAQATIRTHGYLLIRHVMQLQIT